MIVLLRISRFVVNYLFWIACLRLVSAVDIITTIAGTGTGTYSGDNGQATDAGLYGPYGVYVDATGEQHHILVFMYYFPNNSSY